ncbi:MAG: hypothetical protein ACHQNE_04660 [Candidatus Kapaibacterium sp.]
MTDRPEHLYKQEPKPMIAHPKRPRWDTILANKLGIKPEMMVLVLWPPPGFMESVGYEAGNYAIEIDTHRYEYIHSFISSRFILESTLPILIDRLVPDGVLWISWPAENSEARKSELTIRSVRELARANGLLEVKTLKIDEQWKAVKFIHDPHRPVPIEIEKRPVLRFGL